MAQAADQHTPTEWDEDRWTLDDIFDYLTKALGYPEERALYEMERARLARRLVLRVQKIVDGKPQGDPEYLPFNKKHKLVRDLGWVVPQNHKWGNNRWTEYRQVVLDLWPSRPPASQTVANQQLEHKVGPDPLKTGRPPAAQRRPTKASKPDSGAKPSRKPSSAQVDRDAAIKRLLDNGDRPPSNVTWPRFCQTVRVGGDGFIGDPKNEKYKRGFTDDTIEDVTRELMKSLAL